MANEIYLMIDEKKDFALFKVGFTSNALVRFVMYATHNPFADCISRITTYEKSKRKVETAFHAEIIVRGYEFVNSHITGQRTEWFQVSYDDPFYETLKNNGLLAFKCGKGRKDKGGLIYNIE